MASQRQHPQKTVPAGPLGGSARALQAALARQSVPAIPRLAVFLVVLGGCHFGERPEPGDYLPAHPGDIWCFDGAPGQIVVESVEKRDLGERIRLIWRRPDGSIYRRQELERREDGTVYALTTGRNGRIAFDPPQCISPRSDEVGFAILSEVTVADSGGIPRRFSREWAVVGRESIETPAGTFHGCLHMRESLRDLSVNPLGEKVTDWWFAPGFGWVGHRTTREGETVPGGPASGLVGARIGGRRLGRLPRPANTSPSGD